MTDRLSIREITRAQVLASRVGEHLDWVRLIEVGAELHERVKVFEAAVWFPRLKPMVNGTEARGMSGQVRGIKVLTWCCAGRCLVQLERRGHSITLITADDEEPWQRDNAHVAPGMGPMGIQGLDAEYLEALKLLYEATRYGGEIVLQRDDKVTMAM